MTISPDSGPIFVPPQKPLPSAPVSKTSSQRTETVTQISTDAIQDKPPEMGKKLVGSPFTPEYVQPLIQKQEKEINKIESALEGLKGSLALQKNPQKIDKLNGEIKRLEMRLAVAKQHESELQDLAADPVFNDVLSFCRDKSQECQEIVNNKQPAEDKCKAFRALVEDIKDKITNIENSDLTRYQKKQLNDLLRSLFLKVYNTLALEIEISREKNTPGFFKRLTGQGLEAEQKFQEERADFGRVRLEVSLLMTPQKIALAGPSALGGSRTDVSQPTEMESRPTIASIVLSPKATGTAEQINRTATTILGEVPSKIEIRMNEISTKLSGDVLPAKAELDDYIHEIEVLELALQEQKRGSSSTRRKIDDLITKAETLKEQIDVLKKMPWYDTLRTIQEDTYFGIAQAKVAQTEEASVEIIHQLLEKVSKEVRPAPDSDATIFPPFVQSVERVIDVEAKGFLVRSEEEQRLVDDLLEGKKSVDSCDQAHLRLLLAKGMVFQIHFGSQPDHELQRILTMLSTEKISDLHMGPLIFEYKEKFGFEANKPVYESLNRLEPEIAKIQKQTTALARPGFVTRALQLVSRKPQTKISEPQVLASARASRKAIEREQFELGKLADTSSVGGLALQRSEVAIAEFDKVLDARLGRDFNQAVTTAKDPSKHPAERVKAFVKAQNLLKMMEAEKTLTSLHIQAVKELNPSECLQLTQDKQTILEQVCEPLRENQTAQLPAWVTPERIAIILETKLAQFTYLEPGLEKWKVFDELKKMHDRFKDHDDYETVGKILTREDGQNHTNYGAMFDEFKKLYADPSKQQQLFERDLSLSDIREKALSIETLPVAAREYAEFSKKYPASKAEAKALIDSACTLSAEETVLWSALTSPTATIREARIKELNASEDGAKILESIITKQLTKALYHPDLANDERQKMINSIERVMDGANKVGVSMSKAHDIILDSDLGKAFQAKKTEVFNSFLESQSSVSESQNPEAMMQEFEKMKTTLLAAGGLLKFLPPSKVLDPTPQQTGEYKKLKNERAELLRNQRTETDQGKRTEIEKKLKECSDKLEKLVPVMLCGMLAQETGPFLTFDSGRRDEYKEYFAVLKGSQDPKIKVLREVFDELCVRPKRRIDDDAYDTETKRLVFNFLDDLTRAPLIVSTATGFCTSFSQHQVFSDNETIENNQKSITEVAARLEQKRETIRQGIINALPLAQRQELERLYAEEQKAGPQDLNQKTELRKQRMQIIQDHVDLNIAMTAILKDSEDYHKAFTELVIGLTKINDEIKQVATEDRKSLEGDPALIKIADEYTKKLGKGNPEPLRLWNDSYLAVIQFATGSLPQQVGEMLNNTPTSRGRRAPLHNLNRAVRKNLAGTNEAL